MATPSVAPEPASPTRCSEPMFEAKIDAPTMNQPRLPPGQKVVVGRVLALPDHPPGQAEDDAEVGGNHQPVDATENGHSETSLGVNVSEFEFDFDCMRRHDAGAGNLHRQERAE